MVILKLVLAWPPLREITMYPEMLRPWAWTGACELRNGHVWAVSLAEATQRLLGSNTSIILWNSTEKALLKVSYTSKNSVPNKSKWKRKDTDLAQECDATEL